MNMIATKADALTITTDGKTTILLKTEAKSVV